jgi:hypothetical protein
MADNEEEQIQDSSHERANAIVDQAKQRAQRKAEQAAVRGAKAGGKAAVQGGRAAAQAGMQASRAAVQLATQAAAAVAQAAASALSSLVAATSEVWVPVALIIIGVILIIFIIVSGFIFFFVGTPPPSGTNLCGGECKISCSSSEIEDPSAVCSQTNTGEDQVCCLSTRPNLECEDVNGRCVSSDTCPSGTSQNPAQCNDPNAPLCCVRSSPCGNNGQVYPYCQYDPQWSRGCFINHYGCSPTSIAMVMSGFGDTQWTPLSVALTNHKMGCFGDSFVGEAFGWMRSQGYTIAHSYAGAGGRYFNTSMIRNYLAQGYLILAGADIQIDLSQDKHLGHAFVISALDGNGDATVYDPTFCNSSTGYSVRVRQFNVDRFNGHPLYKWFYAYPVKKISC